MLNLASYKSWIVQQRYQIVSVASSSQVKSYKSNTKKTLPLQDTSQSLSYLRFLNAPHGHTQLKLQRYADTTLR